MSVTTSANVRNLNESRAQALLALQSASERLGDILGEIEFSGDGTRRNESGDLVNEEGLPIIDITEPIGDPDTHALSAATEHYKVIEEDNYPEPISTLTPEALAVSRKHRDKILDLLEQEEEREERRTRQELQLEIKRKREAARTEMDKRMLTQGLDLEKRRQTKELEKRMAKALISGLGEPKTVKSNVSAVHPDGKTKKVVTFAEPPSPESNATPNVKKQTEINWGDVVPATLPARKGRVAGSHVQPMKMEVVERTSSPRSSNPISTLRPSEKSDMEPAKDSDDESDLGLSPDPIVLESDNEDVVLSAQRHRELALEYHQRREALISSAGTLKLEDDELLGDRGHDANSWDKEEVPLDATLAHQQPKPRISKFKASVYDRNDSQTPTSIAQTMGPPSSSRGSTGPAPSITFGNSVLPGDSLSKSIKLGKLVDGQLVAGPHDDNIDTEEREEEEIRKLLLKSMEEYSGIAAQVMGPAAKGSYWANSAIDETASSSRPSPVASTSRAKPKASRFKVNRTQSRAPSGPEALASHETISLTSAASEVKAASASPSGKPISTVERSSPNLTSFHQNHTSTATPQITSSTRVIDSPSFAPLSGNRLSSGTPNHRVSSVPPTSHAMVIDSPSFIPPPSPDIIESPSSRRPIGSARVPPTIIPTPSKYPSERQAVMAENVSEKSTDHNPPVHSTSNVNTGRVSKFKADRSIDV